MKKLLAFLLAAVMVFAFVACGSSSSDSTEAEPETETAEGAEEESTEDEEWIVNVGGTQSVGDFLYGDGQDYNYLCGNLVYDYLFTYNRETKENQSDVLDDWYYEDDTTFVMVMKDGITFADGNAMTGDDIIFSLRSYIDDEANSYSNYVDFIDFDSSTVDGNTITLVFTAPQNGGLFGMRFPIYEKAWAEERGWSSPDWASAPMGSGPYEVTEYVTDSYMVLSKRDDYWGDASGLPDQIKYTYYSENTTQYIDLETGAIDMATAVAYEDASRAFEEGDTIECAVVGDGANMFFTLNQTNNSYLQNINVRKAIAHGVDWDAISELVSGEYYISGTSVINTMSEYYTEIGHYDYDPDYAKQCLEDAGVSEGEITLTYMGPELETQKVMVEAIQAYLLELGINLDIQFCDGGVFIPAWIAGECDTLFNTNGSGSPNGDPTTYLNDYLETGNFVSVHVNDSTYDEMYNAAATCVDTEEAQELWTALAQYCYDNYLLLEVNENVSFIAYDSSKISTDSLFTGAANPNLRMITYIEP